MTTLVSSRWILPSSGISRCKYLQARENLDESMRNSQKIQGSREAWKNSKQSPVRHAMKTIPIAVELVSKSFESVLGAICVNRGLHVQADKIEITKWLKLISSGFCCYFSDVDLRTGISEEKRDRMLRTYIHNFYQFHLNEIFYVLRSCTTFSLILSWMSSLTLPWVDLSASIHLRLNSCALASPRSR